jgi:carboxyl-terminal processing protease
MRLKTASFMGLSLLIGGVILGTQLNGFVARGDTSEGIRKLEAAFITISDRYVEDVDSAHLAEHAIKGMLEHLDPHSIYIDTERMRAVTEDFDASFEGIGISYEFIEGDDGKDTLAVLNPIPGGPSDEAGLFPGDRIIRVDGEDAVGFSTEDVERSLKGRRGTEVDVTVVRPGMWDTLQVTITRDRIPLHTMDVAYMIDDRTGYIRLNRFARTTYDEFAAAVRDLKSQGMDRLLLDLRDNAGGFMDMAIRISDEMLGSRQEIVSARSRHSEYTQTSRSRSGGLFTEGPVIVLINERSASASEIVAGALQDHDRALVVGRRSFGKGLVQKQFSLLDGSALRMTISRFYTPAGRLIQTPYDNGLREDYYREKYDQRRRESALSVQDIIEEAADSLRFETAKGRIVLGGGGILPDYLVYSDTLAPAVRAVRSGNLDQRFVRNLLDRERTELRSTWADDREGFIADFRVDDELYSQFVHFALNQQPGSETARRALSRETLEENRETLATLLKATLASRLYGRDAWYPVYHQLDRVVQEAMALWEPAHRLALL